ncbi:family S53 protease [Trametes meyenii]|nr:family S53 protease [Trametes meyenii]
MQVHDVRSAVPRAFHRVGPAPPDAILDLRIALVQNDFPGLEKKLMDVSMPGSPLYGQHLSKTEAQVFVAPKPESEAAVGEWLADNGIEAKRISPAGDWLAFSISVGKASELLAAEFSVYNHTPTGKTFIRTLEYSIPASLKGHLNFVHPVTAFVQPFARRTFDMFTSARGTGNRTARAARNLPPNATIPSSCEFFITPQCLLDLYGIPAASAANSTSRFGLGVNGFDDQFASKLDLSLFLDTFRPDLPLNTTFAFQSVDDGKNPQGTLDAGIEANIDIQYTVGIAAGVPTTFFSIGTNSTDGVGGFMDLALSMLSQDTLPVVVTSSSFGFNENELTPNVVANLCNMYAHLGVLGLTFVFNSGDGGVAGCVSEECTAFVPTFPSSCPFVTSVGATTGIPEVAASFSSGGFSNVLNPLNFQEEPIQRYLARLGRTNQGLFSPIGRGFPDIATQGEDVEIVLRGVVGAVSGTGCCAPVIASIFSLLDDELAAVGRAPLGFVNPLLYSLAGTAAFTDITNGSNPGCGTDGFPALPGWDPVTGLGTPNYIALRTALGL